MMEILQPFSPAAIRLSRTCDAGTAITATSGASGRSEMCRYALTPCTRSLRALTGYNRPE